MGETKIFWLEILVIVSLHKRKNSQQIEDKSFGTFNPNWGSHAVDPNFNLLFCIVLYKMPFVWPNIYPNCFVWICACVLFKLILTASLWIGCTANIIPAIIAKLSWRRATMMQTRVNSTQTMACNKMFVKWNQTGFKPNK